MCGGGRAAPATIVMPNTGAYDREFDLQRAAMEQQMQGQASLMQMQLQQSLRSKEELMGRIKEVKIAQANDEAKVDEQARRMSALIGPPPPEPTAQKPVVGDDRRAEQGLSSTRRGKSRLRIERPVAAKSGQGSGLNIT